MDGELQRLFRDVEAGAVDKLPQLGLYLRRAGMTMTRNTALSSNEEAAQNHGKYFFAPQTLEEAGEMGWVGAVYLPWTSPPIGQIVERRDGYLDGDAIDKWMERPYHEIRDEEPPIPFRIDVGTRKIWGRVVGVVTNARTRDNHCQSCNCSHLNENLGFWIIDGFRDDGRLQPEHVRKCYEAPCNLVPVGYPQGRSA